MEKITITRALAELKLLSKKITDKIEKSKFCGITQKRHGKIIGDNKTAIEYEKETRSNYDSINNLINRYRDIKNKVLKSNSKIKVKIAGKSYTVAEAIELKNSIGFEKELYEKINIDRGMMIDKIEANRIKLENDVKTMLENNLGTDRKAQKDNYENIAKPFIEANEFRLVVGFDIDKIINGLNDKIESFLNEVDFVLSESNSQNYIEI